MAIVAPFRGLTYNPKKTADMSKLVAPPYDVINDEEQGVYYQSDPYNVIRLILGKKKIGDSDWDNRYTRSADCFGRWISENILMRARHPSMYVTALTYDPGDGEGIRLRWGLIALVRIEDEGSGVIIPHEKTFSAHRDDRLNLMKASGAQYSQIFSLYEDTENRIFAALNEVINAPPHVSFDFRDGTGHRLWIVQSRALFQKISCLMEDKSILIADGHHRYETARAYRNMMRIRYGKRPLNRAYEYTMMYLSNMDDAGLTILPSHRLIKRRAGFKIEDFLDRIGEWFDVSPLSVSLSDSGSDWVRLKKILEEKGRYTSTMGFYHRGSDKYYILALKPEKRKEMGDDLHASLMKLDVLVLSRFLLQRALGFSKEDLDDEKIFHYHSDMAETLSMVDAGTYQMAFILNPTRMEHVKEVAGNGLTMPRKSTYFYPKILTGLVLNKIDPHELVQMP